MPTVDPAIDKLEVYVMRCKDLELLHKVDAMFISKDQWKFIAIAITYDT